MKGLALLLLHSDAAGLAYLDPSIITLGKMPSYLTSALGVSGGKAR